MFTLIQYVSSSDIHDEIYYVKVGCKFLLLISFNFYSEANI